jgi:hypothetical protein
LRVLNQAYDHPQPTEEKAVAPLAGGLMQYGYQCGMIWGAALAAGAEAHRRHGPGPRAEAAAIRAAGRLVDVFRAGTGEIDCFEITDVDRTSSKMKMIWVFLLKGKTIGCMRMADRYARTAVAELESVLPGPTPAPADLPVSCAAELARRMGASDTHATMAAGFAGGLGLCGGACGALGAAIWLTALGHAEAQGGRADFKDPAAQALIDRFLACTGHAFTCAEIVGRQFESVEEHAAFLRDGGCAEVIGALADG